MMYDMNIKMSLLPLTHAYIGIMFSLKIIFFQLFEEPLKNLSLRLRHI